MRVIIIGTGKPVYFLTQQLISERHHVHIITPDPGEAQSLSQQSRAIVLVGDGTEQAMQEEGGAREADVLVSLLEQDEDNLIACQVAQRVFGVPRTIALIHDPANESIFQKLGVSATVSVVQIITLMVEEQLGLDEVTNLIALAKGRITISEMVLGRDAPVIHKTITEAGLPDNSLVATIIRNDDVIIPYGSTQFLPYDRLILITEPDSYGTVMEILTGKEVS